jgi:hypothetical protein
MLTETIYGAAPVDLGLVDLSPTEMMFWLYCPIKLPGMQSVSVPDNLANYRPIWERARLDCGDRWGESYAYITAKTLWVTPENPGNRPGWHSDGFLTDDLNYIWSDTNPTIFWEPDQRYRFSADHLVSLSQMGALAESDVSSHVTYPIKHMLRLDQAVLHKVNTGIKAGLRTFVKISVSRHRYALRGNSINHELASGWTYANRHEERNCPIGAGV